MSQNVNSKEGREWRGLWFESQPILHIYFSQRYEVYTENILQEFVFKILLIVSLAGNISTFGFKRT